MSAFKSLKGSCPVCDGTRKDCRQNTLTNLIHCRHTEVNPPDYIFVKEDKCGFGMWAYKPDVDTRNDERRNEWRQQQEARKQQRLETERQRKAESLDPKTRDRLYREILSQLSLHPDDKADLLRRGFSEEEIERSQFRSVEKWQRLDREIDNRLPGVNVTGRSLNTQPGYLCPIRTADGHIVAMQMRLRGDAEGGRYRWLSSATKTRPNGQTPHVGDELPLTVRRPKRVIRHSRLGFVEGVGSKPFLASERLRMVMIGAAGGQWASSPELLKFYLERIGDQSGGIDECILYPDSASKDNPQIMRNYRALKDLLAQWGHKLKIAWWNQNSKNDPDIDELPAEAYYSIQYISWEQFSGDRPPKGEPPKSKSRPQPVEPDADEYRQYCQQVEEEEATAEAQEAERQRQWNDPEQRAIRDKNQWLKRKKFTPTHEINQQYFDWEVPKVNSLLAVNSGLGSGKTQWLGRVINELKDEKWLSLGYRNTLLIQSVQRFGNAFYHLHHDNAFDFTVDPYYKLALCVDSLNHFRPEDFDDANLILDESMSVVLHLLTSGTLKHRRDSILDKFTEAIKRAKRIILLDGHLTDWTVNYINSIAQKREVVKVKNVHPGCPFQINFVLGTMINTPFGEQLCTNDRSALVKAIQNSERPVICTDSQVEAEALDEILSELALEVLRVDGKTSSEDYIKEFIANPDAYLKKHKPDVLIYTSSCESGLDVSIRDYFTDQFALFFGVISVDSCLQMLGRIRDPNVRRNVWCREFSTIDNENFRSYNSKQIKRTLDDYHNLIADATVEGLDNTAAIKALIEDFVNASHDEHERTWAVLRSIWNYESANFRQCLLERLQEKHNVHVRITARSDEDANLLKESKEAVKRHNCHDIFTSEEIDAAQARRINSSFGAGWKEQCKAAKAMLLEMLPGIKGATKVDEKGRSVPVWSEDFIYRIRYDDRNFVKNCQLAWLLQRPEVARLQDQVHWSKLVSSRTNTFLPDHKSRYAQVKALKELGIEEFLQPENLEKTYANDSPEIVELVERGKIKRISTALGVAVGKREPVRYVGAILKLLGIGWTSKQYRDYEGNRFREYAIDRRSLSDPDRAAVMDCLSRRWERYQNGEVEIPNFTRPEPQKEAIEFEQNSAPENPTQQGVDAVTDSCNFLNKKGSICDKNPEVVLTPVIPEETVNSEQNPTRQTGQPKVGDRIRVNLPGYKPHGLEGVVVALQTDNDLPYVTALEAPAEVAWLSEYRAKAEWLEVV